MSYSYSEEQIVWLRENARNYNSYEILANSFNEKFEENRTVSAIRQCLTKRLKIQLITKKRSFNFTKEEDAWIFANFDKYATYAELAEAFNSEFSKNRKESAVKEHCAKALGLKGKVNLGKFQDGNEKERLPIGSVRTSANGCVYIKVAECPQAERYKGYQEPYWKPIQKKIWEDIYGEIPKGKMICFLDGNRDNLSFDNLYCIDRRISAVMSKNKWWTSSREHTLTAIKWCELYYALKE